MSCWTIRCSADTAELGTTLWRSTSSRQEEISLALAHFGKRQPGHKYEQRVILLEFLEGHDESLTTRLLLEGTGNKNLVFGSSKSAHKCQNQDRTSLPTSPLCPHCGSDCLENFGTSVRIRIGHRRFFGPKNVRMGSNLWQHKGPKIIQY